MTKNKLHWIDRAEDLQESLSDVERLIFEGLQDLWMHIGIDIEFVVRDPDSEGGWRTVYTSTLPTAPRCFDWVRLEINGVSYTGDVESVGWSVRDWGNECIVALSSLTKEESDSKQVEQ